MAALCTIADLSVFKVALKFLINISRSAFIAERNQLGDAETRFDVGGNGGEDGVMLA